MMEMFDAQSPGRSARPSFPSYEAGATSDGEGASVNLASSVVCCSIHVIARGRCCRAPATTIATFAAHAYRCSFCAGYLRTNSLLTSHQQCTSRHRTRQTSIQAGVPSSSSTARWSRSIRPRRCAGVASRVAEATDRVCVSDALLWSRPH